MEMTGVTRPISTTRTLPSHPWLHVDPGELRPLISLAPLDRWRRDLPAGSRALSEWWTRAERARGGMSRSCTSIDRIWWALPPSVVRDRPSVAARWSSGSESLAPLLG